MMQNLWAEHEWTKNLFVWLFYPTHQNSIQFPPSDKPRNIDYSVISNIEIFSILFWKLMGRSIFST